MIIPHTLEAFQVGLTPVLLAEQIAQQGIHISLDAGKAIKLLPAVSGKVGRMKIRTASAGELGVAGITEEELFGESARKHLLDVHAKPLQPLDALLYRFRCETPEDEDCVWCVHEPVAIWIACEYIFAAVNTGKGPGLNVVHLEPKRLLHSQDMLAVEDLS